MSESGQSKITDLQEFLKNLAIPDSCELNKPVFKKMFLDNGVLDTADKACLKDDVGKVKWLYTLKPSTINVATYKDENRDYSEIAVLSVELSVPKRIKRIAHFMQRSIPYPLVLIFSCTIDHKKNMAISLADKRINQADKEKWVIEDSICTNWIELEGQDAAEALFLQSCNITNFSYRDYWAFYQSLTERVIAINCATHSGEFTHEKQNANWDGLGRLDMLRNIESLTTQISEISNKLSKEKQMGKQVELNTQIKQMNDEIELIKKRI